MTQFSMYDWNIVNRLAFRKPHMILLLSNSIFKLSFYQIIVLHAKKNITCPFIALNKHYFRNNHDTSIYICF